MSWLDRVRGRATPPPLPDRTGVLPERLPLDLRINGCVALDTLVYRAHPEALTAKLPEGHQGIPCYGHIDLGGGHALHRFYLDDDAYVQVSTANGAVEGIKAFVFVDTVNPHSQREFEAFVQSHPHLGAAAIEFAGRQWQRDFSSDAGDARIPPVAYDEVLYRHDPPRRDDDLTHYAMLYRRAVPELERDEFLLVTAEDYGPNEFVITYAIGLDLTTADLDIT